MSEYLGNFSAVDPAYSRGMFCAACDVEWTGCWDNFQCPKCMRGELPSVTNHTQKDKAGVETYMPTTIFKSKKDGCGMTDDGLDKLERSTQVEIGNRAFKQIAMEH